MAFDRWLTVGWVEPGGSFGVIGDSYGPAFFVHIVVVERAQKLKIHVGGRAAVQMLFAVVGFAERCRPVALGLAGEVDEGVGAAASDALFERVAVRVGFTQERTQGRTARSARYASRAAISCRSVSVLVALSITVAWAIPSCPACHVLVVTGSESASARPSWTRSDAQAPPSPDSCQTKEVIEAAPPTAYSPVRSARSMSRQVASCPCVLRRAHQAAARRRAARWSPSPERRRSRRRARGTALPSPADRARTHVRVYQKNLQLGRVWAPTVGTDGAGAAPGVNPSKIRSRTGASENRRKVHVG